MSPSKALVRLGSLCNLFSKSKIITMKNKTSSFGKIYVGMNVSIIKLIIRCPYLWGFEMLVCLCKLPLPDQEFRLQTVCTKKSTCTCPLDSVNEILTCPNHGASVRAHRATAALQGLNSPPDIELINTKLSKSRICMPRVFRCLFFHTLTGGT